MVKKTDSETGEIKFRVVLDLSRYINKLIQQQHVTLEDNKATEALRQPEDFICTFDLENQFFHVRLQENAKEYFGFAGMGRRNFTTST